MASQTVNGTLYFQPPNTANTVGHKGAIVKASATNNFVSVAASRYNSAIFGSTVVENINNKKSLSSGSFSKLNQIVSQKITTKLASVDNNVLTTSANQPALENSINSIQQVRTRKITTAIRTGNFSLITGKYTTGFPVNQVDTFDTDNAANPTRTNPGSLVFNNGILNITTYTKKTG